MLKFFRGKVLFLIIFANVKGIVFFTPLFFADILSPEDFGILEYALAGLGFVLNSVLNLGVPGAFPYFILRKKDLHLRNGFVLHPLWLGGIFFLNSLIYLIIGFDPKYYLALNVAFVIASQIFYSTKLKTFERSAPAVVVDSALYLILFCIGLLMYLDFIPATIEMINLIVFIYSLYFIGLAIQKYAVSSKESSVANYIKILKYSMHLLIGSFLIFLITSSGRILVEGLVNIESVGIYGFYYRLSAAVVMIYQVVSIIYFKKIYLLDPHILDKYYAMFFAGIYFLSGLLFYILPEIIGVYSEFFRETYIQNRIIYFILSGQMVMWIASALNSNIIDRENIVKVNNLRFVILLIAGSILLWILNPTIDLAELTYFVYAILTAACFVQYYSLLKNNIKFNYSALVLFISFLITTLGVIYD